MSNIFSGNTFVKISELDETIEFDSSDEFVVVNDSVTQKITGLNLTESIVSIGNLASRAYVDAVVDGAPALLDTLNELASALNDDANFATNIIASIGTKLSTANFGALVRYKIPSIPFFMCLLMILDELKVREIIERKRLRQEAEEQERMELAKLLS